MCHCIPTHLDENHKMKLFSVDYHKVIQLNLFLLLSQVLKKKVEGLLILTCEKG